MLNRRRKDRRQEEIPKVVVGSEAAGRVTRWWASCSRCGRLPLDVETKAQVRGPIESHLRAAHGGVGRIVDLEHSGPRARR